MDKKQEQISRVKILTTLFTAFGQGDDGNRIAVYAKMFNGMPVNVLDAACRKIMYEKTFMPSVAEILQAAQNLVEENQGTRQLTWAEALTEIEKQMRDEGCYGLPRFSTDEIRKTVEAIGWRNLCCGEARDYPIVRAQMKAIYENFCKRNRESGVNKLVCGQERLVEIENKMRLLY